MLSLASVRLALVLAFLVACGGDRPRAATDAGGDDGAGSDANGDAEPSPDGGDDGGVRTVVDGIVSRSSASAYEAETHLAIAPDGTIGVVWIALPQPGDLAHIGYTFSTTGGATWGPIGRLDALDGRLASDPSITVGADGTFTVAWIGLRPTGNNMQVYAARAPRGGGAFAAPVVVSSPAELTLDKPWITTTASGALLVSYASFVPDTSRSTIVVARSTDGVAWSASIGADGMGVRNLAYLCPGSRVFMAYLADAEGVALRWSDDDGATWPAANVAAIAPSPELQAIPSCASAGDDAWLLYGLTNDSPTGDLTAKDFAFHVAHATRGATSFDRDVAASAADGSMFFTLEQIAIEDGGALDVVYYAGGSDGDPAGSFRRVRSVDMGRSFVAAPALRAPLLFTSDRTMSTWLGDYVGLRPRAQEIFLSFTTNGERDRTSHVAFARVAAGP